MNDFAEKLPKYLFYNDTKMMTLWKTILGFLLFPQFLIYSFKASLDECIEIETSTTMWFFTLIIEILFIIDFVLNFLMVSRDMK